MRQRWPRWPQRRGPRRASPVIHEEMSLACGKGRFQCEPWGDAGPRPRWRKESAPACLCWVCGARTSGAGAALAQTQPQPPPWPRPRLRPPPPPTPSRKQPGQGAMSEQDSTWQCSGPTNICPRDDEFPKRGRPTLTLEACHPSTGFNSGLIQPAPYPPAPTLPANFH